MVAFQQRCFNTCNFETYLYDLLLLEEPEKLSRGSLASGRTVWAAVLSLQPQRAAVLRLHPSQSLLSKLSFNLSSLCLYCALKGLPGQLVGTDCRLRAVHQGLCAGLPRGGPQSPKASSVPAWLPVGLSGFFLYLPCRLTYPPRCRKSPSSAGWAPVSCSFLEQRGHGSGLPGSDPWPPTPSSRGDLWRPLPLTTGSLPRLWGKSPGGQHRGPEGGWRLDVDLWGRSPGRIRQWPLARASVCVCVCTSVCLGSPSFSPVRLQPPPAPGGAVGTDLVRGLRGR